MSEKISVLDVEIDELTAKEALRESIRYMESEPVNVIEMVTVDALMRISKVQNLTEDIRSFDLMLAGDKTILEAADVSERKILQDTENRTYFKLFVRYLHKNHKRVYLLVESDEEGDRFYQYLEEHYSGIQIVGLAKVSANDRADDMLVNDINGGEVDCVFSALSVPLQEEFIVKNKGLLNARIWLGLGKDFLPVNGQGTGFGKITRFVEKHIFKKEIEKRKRVDQMCAVKCAVK